MKVIALAAFAAALAACSNISPGSPALPSNPALTQHRIRPAITDNIIYAFGTQSGDGTQPLAGVIDVNGVLYGTTASGGSSGFGTVFSVSTSGNETVLHNFAGVAGSDGANPSAALTLTHGNLYGTTGSGGNGPCYASGCGTVFELPSFGNYKVLYNFQGAPDGYSPKAALINVGGSLYGTTQQGGPDNTGTVFQISRTGSESVVYGFTGNGDGRFPSAGLTNFNGMLYGTAGNGGANGFGCVYAVTIAGVESVIYSFKGGTADGAYPIGGLVKVGGNLYGTTAQGGSSGLGTIFRITASGTETPLYSFAGGSDGAYPEGGLTNGHNGTMYGTTAEGGTRNFGTVFLVTRSGAEVVLYRFAAGTDGAGPVGNLIDVGGTLYGTTQVGGAGEGGTVYSITL